MIYIYKILSIILIPLIKFNIQLRLFKGKELISRYKERYGETSHPISTNKEVIWIHAASVGEFKSTDYIISKYYKDFTILITTTTVSAANYAKKYYKNKIIHQFAPFDIDIWVKKFLKNWNPKLIIWIESDLWPNTLYLIKKNKINAILFNLRISPKSLKRWRLIPFFYDNLIKCFNEVFAQSEIDQKRIKLLTNEKILYFGNLKLINLTIKKIKNKIIKNNSEVITIMLTSTHSKEEKILLPIFNKFIKKHKNIQLIIAPRHSERCLEIKSICEQFNLSNIYESKINDKKNLKEVIIIDSFGILNNYFEKSDIVVMGGSFVPSGGHNPIEPSLHNCAILTGPKLFNWEDVFDNMSISKACIKVKSLEDLEININNLLISKEKINKLKTNAFNFAQKQFVDTNLLDKTINKYMRT